MWLAWNLTALLITARHEKTRFIKSVFQKQSNRVRVAFPFQESGLCKHGLKSVLTVTGKMIAIAMTRTKCTKRTRNRYFTSWRIQRLRCWPFMETLWRNHIRDWKTSSVAMKAPVCNESLFHIDERIEIVAVLPKILEVVQRQKIRRGFPSLRLLESVLKWNVQKSGALNVYNTNLTGKPANLSSCFSYWKSIRMRCLFWNHADMAARISPRRLCPHKPYQFAGTSLPFTIPRTFEENTHNLTVLVTFRPRFLSATDGP